MRKSAMGSVEQSSLYHKECIFFGQTPSSMILATGSIKADVDVQLFQSTTYLATVSNKYLNESLLTNSQSKLESTQFT